jgi:hypothetical protein
MTLTPNHKVSYTALPYRLKRDKMKFKKSVMKVK